MLSEEFFKPEHLLAFPLYVLVILGALLLHEMGHYLAARIFKIPIQDVVIGRGKLLRTWTTKTGVEWKIRLLPIGAHVHLRDIEARPFFQKIMTILAGPLINFIIIPLLFFAFYVAIGQPSIPNKVVGVEEGLPAFEAGIKPGDQFIAVEGIPLKNYDDIWRIAYGRKTQTSTFTVRRDNEVFDVTLTPDWAEYRDLRGVPRENARLGIVWKHHPFSLKDIVKIEGQNVEDQENLTRELLIANFNKHITISTISPIDEQNPIHVYLDASLNKGLLDENDEFYDGVFLGTTYGNVYMGASFAENSLKAIRYASELFINVAKIPFQIFPIDKSKLQDRAAVSDPETKIVNHIYSFIHLFAVASIAIGLINLLPFPNLDGGQLIEQILKKMRGDRLTNKFRAKVFVTSFFILYASVFITNMDNLHGYIDFSFKKVHEWMDQKAINIKSEESDG